MSEVEQLRAEIAELRRTVTELQGQLHETQSCVLEFGRMAQLTAGSMIDLQRFVGIPAPRLTLA